MKYLLIISAIAALLGTAQATLELGRLLWRWCMLRRRHLLREVMHISQ
jgi:hypothetical protein